MISLPAVARRFVTPESAFGRLVEAALTPHPIDRYLEHLDPMITWTEARARVERIERRTPGSVTLTLRTTRQFDGFRAGQFVQLGVVIDGVRHVRCFSPAGADSSRRSIELTVTRRDGGLVSNHLCDHARVGDVYTLGPAGGSFQLTDPRPSQILLIAGGSGITPVLSMLRTLVGNGYPGSVALLYYAQTPTDNAYAAELDALGDHPSVTVQCVYTRSGNAGPLRTGHFDADHLDAIAPSVGDAQTYLCGPDGLRDAVTREFDNRGIADRLHIEEFTLATPAAGDAGGTVRYATSGVSADNDGRALLEQAESAGLTPEYGCRMGICFSCTTVKKSGRTRNLRTGDLNDDPDQHVQLCITAPVGDVELAL